MLFRLRLRFLNCSKIFGRRHLYSRLIANTYLERRVSSKLKEKGSTLQNPHRIVLLFYKGPYDSSRGFQVIV